MLFMNLDSLYIALPAQSPTEIQQWWNAFAQINPNGDREEFFKWLFDQEHITELQYWDALDGAEMSLFADIDLVPHQPDVEKVNAPETPEDSYQFIAELGAGAMGEVHIVKEGFLRRKVALKFIRPIEQTTDPKLDLYVKH